MPELCFEDFIPGEVTTYGDYRLTREEIVRFAGAFDPQPYHLDERLAEQTFAGGLIASGWHSNALMNRINCDGFLNRSSCMGSPGLAEVRWLRPVRPGDRLSMRRTIVSRRTSRSKPDRGTVRFIYELLNQHGEIAVHHDCQVIFGRRQPAKPAEMPDEAPQAALARPEDPSEDAARPRMRGVPYLEDLSVGQLAELGTYQFTADNIHAFALAYDNQSFHIDPAAAQHGPFGGIIASGWHTGSAWMGCMVRDRQARMQAAGEAGEPAAQMAVSPGFRNLRWLRPVRPGDTLTFRLRIDQTRISQSRPGWGLVFSRNSADNQRGERVFEFTGSVFWERRPP